MTPGFDEDEYRSLLVAYPPRPITDESELPAIEEQIWKLLDVDDRSEAQNAYLTLLSDLVQHWEREHVAIPPLSGVELVKQLLVERGLRQKDLIQVFGSESHVSDVLSGRRELRTKHIDRLAELFHVSPAVFFAKRNPGVDPLRRTFLISRAEPEENVHDDSASTAHLHSRIQSTDG